MKYAPEAGVRKTGFFTVFRKKHSPNGNVVPIKLILSFLVGRIVNKFVFIDINLFFIIDIGNSQNHYGGELDNT